MVLGHMFHEVNSSCSTCLFALHFPFKYQTQHSIIRESFYRQRCERAVKTCVCVMMMRMMNISNSVSGCSQESFAAVLRRIPSACSLRTRTTTSTGRDTAQPHATPNTRPTRGPAGTAAAPNRVRASQAFRTESVWQKIKTTLAA